jgi:hypothetical protein
MIKLESVKKLSAGLEIGAVTIAVAGLLFRATFYWTLQPEPGKAYGTGAVLDFVFALALFLVCTLCTVSGVVISFMGVAEDKRLAYRAALVGILSFVGYEFLHGHLPRLM